MSDTKRCRKCGQKKLRPRPRFSLDGAPEWFKEMWLHGSGNWIDIQPEGWNKT